MIMSLVMRIHLVWPGAHLPLLSSLDNSPERYAALTLLHGSLMVLMVLTAAPQAGFGNYLLPIQIGARDMAFPTLNLLAFWSTALSLIGVTAAFFLPPETGLTLWIASVALFCAAALANALNFSVTTIDLRAKGMTLPRLPITVWAWFINAILSLLIFSILLAACVYLLADRILGTHFFSTASFCTALRIPFPPSSTRPLAALVLVFRPGASLRRHPAVLRHHHASDLDVLAQARLGPSRRRARVVRRRPIRLLHLGTAHLRERPESLFTARFLAAGFFLGSARVDSADELVRHSLER